MDNTFYIIFDLVEINKVNFDLVSECNIESLRNSIDNKKSFFTIIGEMPSFINDMITCSIPYTNEEILLILQGKEWNYDYKD